ncbi:class I SAM-dependent methyltransferase [Sediminivirga luteola]|uniref:Methyltransferase domain-containing protein n=1 Tax=Sediminivirga luteola TaxID=1774748 RepID=A0A8J2XD71_9MICO|nr:class I SAM-dependent methyltransferase [Sediminivirga luteola]GGA04966.1 hypothetical protein GCM10011333_04540 [Sediminivirga luteola]
MGPEDVIALWERQQDSYVTHRRLRFETAMLALEAWRPGPELIVDIGSGPGSFSRLLLQRFPSARVIAIDHDPSLLRLAEHNLAEFGSRAVIADADLTDPSWMRAVDADPDAIVSSTALHWLTTGQLMGLLEQLAQVLPAGRLFLNLDHYSQLAPGSLPEAAAIADATRRRAAADAAGVPDWESWWEAFADAAGAPGLEDLPELLAERDRRFRALGREEEARDASPVLHLEGLRTAGFAEAGTLWQHLDDYIVYGVR